MKSNGIENGDSTQLMSRPARGAWVEMTLPNRGLPYLTVAPRKGRVG